MEKKRLRLLCVIALMHVYVTQANFTTKPRFEIKNKRSFTEMNSQGSRVEKNTHAQKVQMQKILFTNEACWWNLLVWRNHAWGLLVNLTYIVCFFFPAWLWPLYGFYLHRFSTLLFWSDGCNWYQNGVFHSFHIRRLKKQSILLVTNSYIPNWGLQKNADGHISSLGDQRYKPPKYQR